MKIVDLIEKKKKGLSLSEKEIKFFIDGIMNNTIEDYQTSALLMAIYFKGMDLDETTYLTKYMVESGEILDLSDISNNIIDKHSTGGVGDKITVMFLPLVAAAGIHSAKLSGRGLGHTGGTIDKLDSIPGFKTNLDIDDFKKKVKEVGAAIASQTLSLAPADGKLYALRDVTSTVDIIPLIASSVVSKKIASGANHIILDVKYGSGAFIKTPEEAEKLSTIMVEVGKRLGRNICAVISSMNQPLGRAVGNAIEIKEVIEFLKGNMSEDLEELTFELAGVSFVKTGMFKEIHEGKAYLEELIKSGKALEKLKEIIVSQYGNPDVINDYSLLPQAKYTYELKAENSGFVKNIDALSIAKASKALGAGREKKTDSIDYAVGVYLDKKYGEEVKKGETYATIYANNEALIPDSEALIKEAFAFTAEKPPKQSLVYKIIN
ncbi:MAG: thymidine phosphorylase [Candidatus Gastranaerophilales bacterium]|nr:thymidine phosphorylase [Candidatus Gastranaerophilales bacterium]